MTNYSTVARPIRCAICGADVISKGSTCSKRCAANLREKIHPSRGKRRDYPPALVHLIRDLYQSGMTMREVQAEIGAGVRVQNVMERYGIERRRPHVLRNQRGPANHGWRGDDAGYVALHLRVRTVRGEPLECSQCDVNDPQRVYDWANLTGNYQDTNDYARMCRPCHYAYDLARRTATGRRTSPVRVVGLERVG